MHKGYLNVKDYLKVNMISRSHKRIDLKKLKYFAISYWDNKPAPKRANTTFPRIQRFCSTTYLPETPRVHQVPWFVCFQIHGDTASLSGWRPHWDGIQTDRTIHPQRLWQTVLRWSAASLWWGDHSNCEAVWKIWYRELLPQLWDVLNKLKQYADHHRAPSLKPNGHTW